ncbi:MAG: TIGR00645 family protein [Quisquiliibacterium sp.]|jgi:uncharacterized protein (TIGR00645 family)
MKIDENKPISIVPRLIFASRWLQLPLYLGLIIAQIVYVFLFVEELIHLVEMLWNPNAIDATVQRLGIAERNKETVIMIIVLSLIDVVMISNLLIMVIVGGYETFVSRLRLENHPDQPEWLSHVNANVLKVKLATAIIGISSIHLLKSFIAAGTLPEHTLLWQTVIHGMFLVSALAIAAIDRLMLVPSGKH